MKPPKSIDAALMWMAVCALCLAPLAQQASNPHAGMMLFQGTVGVAIMIAAAPWLSSRTRIGKYVRAAVWPFDRLGERDVKSLGSDRSLPNMRRVLRNAGFDSEALMMPYCKRQLVLVFGAILLATVVDMPFDVPPRVLGIWPGVVILFQALPLVILTIAVLTARAIARSSSSTH